MAGTKEGGRKAADTNKNKYGSDFYAKIGAKGGKVGRTGGFYANRELAARAGAIGGRKSRRGPNGPTAAPLMAPTQERTPILAKLKEKIYG